MTDKRRDGTRDSQGERESISVAGLKFDSLIGSLVDWWVGRETFRVGGWVGTSLCTFLVRVKSGSGFCFQRNQLPPFFIQSFDGASVSHRETKEMPGRGGKEGLGYEHHSVKFATYSAASSISVVNGTYIPDSRVCYEVYTY